MYKEQRMEKRNNVEFLSIRMFNINILRVFYKLISFFFPATCQPETNLILFFILKRVIPK